MKFFEYKNDRDEKYLSIFDLNFYKYIKVADAVTINFLGNFLSFYIHSPFEKSVKFLNITLIKYSNVHSDGIWEKRIDILSDFFDNKEAVRNELFDLILQNVCNDYKNIIVIRSALGETYLLQAFWEQYLKNNNISSDDVCIVSRREVACSLFKLFHPYVKTFVIPMRLNKMFYAFEENTYKYRDKNFFIYIGWKYVSDFVTNYKHGCLTHLCNLIYKLFDIKPEHIKKIEPNFYPNIKENLQQKCNSINLDIRNFVIFSPEANSIKSIPYEFWNTLESLFIKKGFDVFWNLTNSKSLGLKKSTKLTLVEMHYLIKYAKGVVGMSSGFLETLTINNNIPFHVFYTPHVINNTSGIAMLKVHTKKEFPFVNSENIYEYVYKKEDEEKIINAIVDSFNEGEDYV